MSDFSRLKHDLLANRFSHRLREERVMDEAAFADLITNL